MIDDIVHWWTLHFWYTTICLVAGAAVVSPFLFSTSFRRWFARRDIDVELIGLAALVVAIVSVGLYNTWGR
jgi:hypothetical protein